MNVVKEIQRINERELEMGGVASWHDQYKDSARVFVGGLKYGLTEGDVITIFSQYGEIVDVEMPRDKETGKSKGFAFVMYEDQRSTILAVDNLNGATLLDRTIRVDHVAHFKERREKDEDGNWIDPEEQRMNARPELIRDDAPSADEGSVSSAPSIDPEDPMRDYLLQRRKEEKLKGKSSKKSKKHEGETPEERRARKQRKKEKKEAKLREGHSSRRERRDEDPRDRHSAGDKGRRRSRSPRARHTSRDAERERQRS